MNGAVTESTETVTAVVSRAGLEGGRTLTHVASRSALWSGVTAVVKGAVRFVTTVVLARHLTPEDFGIVAMAMIVNELISVFGHLGLGAALVQKRDIDEQDVSTVFWANLGLGLVLAAAFFAAAPVAAGFFGNAQVAPVVRVLSIYFFLWAVGGVHRALLTRGLRFDAFAVVQISATLVRSGVALGCLFMGFGLWSMVFGMCAERLVAVGLLATQVPWRPRLVFHWNRLKALFRFSRNLYGERFLAYVSANGDRLIIGRLLGSGALGFYQFALGIPHLVLTHFSQVLTDVLFPVYCKVQDEHARFRRGYVKTCQFISLVTFPVLAGLTIVAPEFIRGVYGTKWLSVVIPLQILCVAAMMRSVAYPMGAVLKAKGRPDIGFKWQLVITPVTIVGVMMGARWGVVGIAIAISGISLLAVIPMRLAMGLIELRFSEVLRALQPAFLGSVMMAAAVWGFKGWLILTVPGLADGWVLLGTCLLGAVTYLAAVRCFWPETFGEFWSFVANMFRR